MEPCEIVLIVTFAVGLFLHIRNILPTWLLGRRLVQAVRKRGVDERLGYWGWQFQMFQNPEGILSESDSPDIRALKIQFIAKWKSSIRLHRSVIQVFIVGFVLSILVQWLSYFNK